MRLVRLLLPTQERTLENSITMVLSLREPSTCTLDPDARECTRLRERADTPVWEREREPETLECLSRSSGCEDKESLEDFSENIERQRRLTETSTITSTSPPRVTNSRTRPSLSKPSTR